MVDRKLHGQDAFFVEDELVSRLVPDPARSQNYIALYGLVGRSEDADYVRLYDSPHLASYFEIRKEDVRERKDEGQLFRAAPTTILWVNRDSTLRLRRQGSEEIRAGLLQGELVENWMSRAEEPGDSIRPVSLAPPDQSLKPSETWICTCNSGCATGNPGCQF